MGGRRWARWARRGAISAREPAFAKASAYETRNLEPEINPLHPRNFEPETRFISDADLYDFYDWRCSERDITIIIICVFQRRKNRKPPVPAGTPKSL